MHPGVDKFMMQLRMESKEKENRNKPAISSPDIVETADFVFSNSLHHDGDSGKLLLAKRKADRKDQYLIKHAYTDCACNEFVYTKLACAMGYRMPDAVLFQRSAGEKRTCFKTEYIIGERYLNVAEAFPSYATVRERAENWRQFFAFHGLYSMTGEGDGVEILLAGDNMIYRVDTTDAFPIGNYQLDFAGIDQVFNGCNPYMETKKQLLSMDLSQILNTSSCDWWFQNCSEKDAEGGRYFLEPFARIQEIRSDYIDGFLDTLCYFYPDYIGDFFKRYLKALQLQSYEYLKTKR